jgi:hypothetical protein
MPYIVQQHVVACTPDVLLTQMLFVPLCQLSAVRTLDGPPCEYTGHTVQLHPLQRHPKKY